MTYNENAINNGRLIAPEIAILEIEIESLKLVSNTLIQLAREIDTKSAKLEKVFEIMQRDALAKLKALMDEVQKSENHGEMVSG